MGIVQTESMLEVQDRLTYLMAKTTRMNEITKEKIGGREQQEGEHKVRRM